MSQYTDLINYYIENLGSSSESFNESITNDDPDSIILDDVTIVGSNNGFNVVPLRECDYVLINNYGKFLFLTGISVKFPGITFKSESSNLWFPTPEIVEGGLSITSLSPAYNRSFLITWYNSLFHSSGCLNEQVKKIHLCLCSVRKFPQSYDETIDSLVPFESGTSTLGLDEWYDERINQQELEVADKFRVYVDKYNDAALKYNSSRKGPLTPKKDYLGLLRICGVFLNCKCSVPEIKIDYQSTNLQRESVIISFSGYIHDSFNINNV